MSQGLGPDFDRAQRRYDAQTPDETSPYVRHCRICHEPINACDCERDYEPEPKTDPRREWAGMEER